MVQKCGGDGVEGWRGPHKRVDPMTGGTRRNMLRVIKAPQRVKTEDLVQPCKCRKKWFIDTTRKTPRSVEWNLLTTYVESCVGEIVKLKTREVAPRAGLGDDPMDVDSLVKGKSQGAKAKVKVKDMASIR